MEHLSHLSQLAQRVAKALGHILSLLVCALVLGGVPGSVVRPGPLVLSAPALPADVADRDSVLRVSARTAKDQGDAPIADATVQAFAMIDGRAFAAGTGRTDKRGAVELRGLPRGEHWVTVDAPECARASAQVVLVGGERALDVVLGKEHRVVVEVRDDRGASIEGAEVEVLGGERLPVGGRTGASGTSTIGRLGPPPWVVKARAKGYEEVTTRGVREVGTRVTLRKLGALLVTVNDATGAKAPDTRVLVAGMSLWPARAAETGADGTVRVGGLSSGTYALRASRGADVSPIEVSVPIERGEEKAVTLTLSPGASVVALALAETGEPVRGARVTLVENGVSPFPLEAVTDAAGRAVLGPFARGPAAVSASADGFVPRGAVPVPETGGEVRVVLVRAGTLVGRVTDARGFPVDGASLVVVGTDFSGAPIDEDPRRTRFREAHFDATLRGPSPLLPMGELGVVPGPVPSIPRSLVPTGAVAPPAARAEPWVTRADGTFTAAPVSPGRVRVLARHPQFTDGVSEIVTLRSSGEATADVVMHRGGTLEGNVVDDAGRPVAGAQVTMSALRGTAEKATRTASDGSFAFAAVPDEVALSVARADDVEPVARMTVKVPEAERRTVTITLPADRPALDARVTDDRGYPVDAAQLSIASLDPAAPLRSTAFTNARGEARIANARGIALRVEARAPGKAPKVVTVEPTAAGLLVTLSPAQSARGRVRAERGSGEGIAAAEVALYTELGVRHATTDRDGAYSLGDLAPGPARLRVRAPGYAPRELAVTLESKPGDANELPLVELVGEGVVEGVVVDGRGDPVQGARVAKDRVPVYVAVGTLPRGVVVTDARGHFRLPELPEGGLTIEIYAPDLGRTHLDGVSVVAGRTLDVGRVVLKKDAEATPEPGARGGVAVTLAETSSGEVVVAAVAEATLAEHAGLLPGDVLAEVDGKKVASMEAARANLHGPTGSDVVVTVRRGGRSVTLRVPREEVRK